MSDNVDGEVEAAYFIRVLQMPDLLQNVSQEDFLENYRMSSQKVGPTISYDIKRDAIIAILFSLIIIFLYISSSGSATGSMDLGR
jgi:SecD/SecF fusion protein